MKINEQGKKIIKEAEGLRLTAYKCPAGIFTIGYGHTGGVKKGDTITANEAAELFEKDIAFFAEKVSRLLTVQLSSNKFSALVSLAYNIGIGRFSKSLLLHYVNRGEYSKAAESFRLYVNANINGRPVVLPGLIKRRNKEKELFLIP